MAASELDLAGVMRLRVAGAPLSVLAQREGVTEADLVERLNAELASKHAAVPPEYAVEFERLDSIQAAAWKNMVGGDAKAASVVLTCIDKRAKLLEAVSRQTPTQRLQKALAYARDRAGVTPQDSDASDS